MDGKGLPLYAGVNFMWHRLFGIKNVTLFGMILLITLAFVLAWNTSSVYQTLALDNQHNLTQELIKLKTKEMVDALFTRQKELAYRLQNETKFRQVLNSKNYTDVEHRLKLVFNRFFVTGGRIHLKSILIRDLGSEVKAAAFEDESKQYSGCPLVIDQITQSSGIARLKPKYALCSVDDDLMAEIVVSIGSLKPRGYLHVIAYVKEELKGLGEKIKMQVRLQDGKGNKLYESDSWQIPNADNNLSSSVGYTLFGDDNVPGINISAALDQSRFANKITDTNYFIIRVTTVFTFLVFIAVLLLLNHAFKPVNTIRRSVGELLDGQYTLVDEPNLPLELTAFVSTYNKMIAGLENASLKRESAEKYLRSERDFISTTLDSITNAVLVLDSKLMIKLVNPAAEVMLGDNEKNLLGYPFEELVIMYANRSASHIVDFKQLLNNPHQLINLFFQSHNETTELELTISPMVLKSSEEIGYVLIFKDVTEDRKLRRKLHYEGRHDKLTGFLNRSAFESRFESMVGDADYTRNQHVMVYLDLDKFKVVNDACGTDAGDLLLIQVAESIKQNVRKSDLVARIGGDEFGILLPYANAESASSTVSDILKNIHRAGFGWDGKQYSITASSALISFGLARDDFSDKFSKLTTACYLAKENGGNQYYLMDDDEDEKVQQHHSSMSWAAGINKGFSEHRFKLYAQPIVPLIHREKRKHYEILIRYQDDDGTIILPNEFLAPAEKFNLIEKIDRWVVSEVIHWLARKPHLQSKVQFSVNLSGHSLGSSDFHHFLEQLLKSDPVDPACLCFEITETAAIKDVEKSIEFIRTFRELGAKFSLDDFGSGLSSFAYLKQFPVDYLKIDGVFIKDILHDAQSYDFVRSITEVGHCLGMKVIAEFVESKQMYHMLRAASVDYLQGYTIGKPAPIELIDQAEDQPEL